VLLNFTGKSGKTIRKAIRDPILLARLRRLKQLGKKRLFAFRDADGRACYLTARDLNEYLREAAGEPVTAKDFRTFAASALALAALCEVDRPDTGSARKRLVAAVMRAASEKLANTPAVTRSSYVHPLVVDAFEDERLQPAMLGGPMRNGLSQAETALMRFLEEVFGERQPTRPARNGRPQRRVSAGSKPEEKQRWLRRASRPSGRSSRASTPA
jgi:DNA topoisomerase-1